MLTTTPRPEAGRPVPGPMAGHSDDPILRHGVLRPGTAFARKPFTPNGLARNVREVLDHLWRFS